MLKQRLSLLKQEQAPPNSMLLVAGGHSSRSVTSQEITLANRNTILAQKVVGCDEVEVVVRNGELVDVVLARELQLSSYKLCQLSFS